MFIYGFWFYEDIINRIGERLSSPRRGSQSDDKFIALTNSHHETFEVKVSSPRMELFRQNPKCVNCDHMGSIWILQGHHAKETPHLNLYHVGDPIPQHKKQSIDGLILMTKDHIIPKSKGGSSGLDNLQTMCVICNRLKDNKLPTEIPSFEDNQFY